MNGHRQTGPFGPFVPNPDMGIAKAIALTVLLEFVIRRRC
jgi:hypothetical protein